MKISFLISPHGKSKNKRGTVDTFVLDCIMMIMFEVERTTFSRRDPKDLIYIFTEVWEKRLSSKVVFRRCSST